MERVISENEKLRRAEEIYNRRREQSVRVPTSKVNSNKGPKKEFSRVQKMILQICICILVYVCLSVIQNSNYIFSESVINKTKDILYYDINFSELLNVFIDNVKNSGLFNGDSEEQNGGAIVDNTSENNDGNVSDDNTVNVINTTNTSSDTNEASAANVSNAAVGGSAGGNATLGTSQTTKYYTDASSYNQMKIDADEIKKKYTLQLPLKKYIISSKFGIRTVDPTFHSGIDLATNSGSAIYAATDGTITLNSSEGDYGKHLKLENGSLVTLYAHCSKLLVKEGAKVKKGQQIAEVGNTGNSSGPHLHFEIIYQGRLVNPEYVQKF